MILFQDLTSRFFWWNWFFWQIITNSYLILFFSLGPTCRVYHSVWVHTDTCHQSYMAQGEVLHTGPDRSNPFYPIQIIRHSLLDVSYKPLRRKPRAFWISRLFLLQGILCKKYDHLPYTWSNLIKSFKVIMCLPSSSFWYKKLSLNLFLLTISIHF